jgi:hypothetical protein
MLDERRRKRILKAKAKKLERRTKLIEQEKILLQKAKE